MTLTKKTGNEKPRPQTGKTADKTRFVRFVDLNKTIEEIEAELVTKELEIVDLQAQIDTLPVGGSAYTETIVNITPTETTYSDGRALFSSGILAMGTTPIELLPPAGANMYYDIEKILLEFSIGSIPYEFDPGDALSIIGYGVIGVKSLMHVPFDVVFNPNGSEISPDNRAAGQASFINTPITLTTVNEIDPTLGDGTFRAIITYTVRTFGA